MVFLETFDLANELLIMSEKGHMPGYRQRLKSRSYYFCFLTVFVFSWSSFSFGQGSTEPSKICYTPKVLTAIGGRFTYPTDLGDPVCIDMIGEVVPSRAERDKLIAQVVKMCDKLKDGSTCRAGGFRMDPEFDVGVSNKLAKIKKWKSTMVL